jgi:hypothetical protein
MPSLKVVMDMVVWAIFYKVFRRSCGLPTRLVGPTDKSASLLIGWTHLSRTAMSLVGGDPGVPMSHKNICLYNKCKELDKNIQERSKMSISISL